MADAEKAEGAANPEKQAKAAPAEAAASQKKDRKRKVAMHLAYLGAGYHGMQRNPGFPTIEAELEEALVKAGAISDENAGSFMKIHWMRAARTDKGVSAACQVVSAKLMVEPKETFAQRVNAHLPAQIRIFGTQRATEGFDARKFCDKRKYEYIMPAWVFDPQACTQGRIKTDSSSSAAAATAAAAAAADTESAAAALQAIAAAVLAAPAADPTAADVSDAEMEQAPAAGAAAVAAAGGAGDDAADASGAESAGGGLVGGAAGRPDKTADEKASTSNLDSERLQRLRSDIAASKGRFVFGPEQLSRLNEVLGQYQGTHNFHNYTVRVHSTDPAAKRFIISFSADLMDIGGQPWVKMVVVGQSFMLHQIRKMVGMAVAVMRGAAPASCLSLALDPDRDLNTPMAPELGLFLDETYYDAYNNRFGELHGPVTFEPFRAAAEAFKGQVLYPHIACSDGQELVNALWLRGCTDTYYKFSRWSKWAPVRDSAALAAKAREDAKKAAGKSNGKPPPQQQQDGKRRQPGAAGAAAVAGGGQPAAKQQRLERPGRLDGATAPMVVAMQETYGMSPHLDTEKAAQARQELKEMRQEYQQVVQQQQQQAEQQQAEQQQAEQQQLPEVDTADLDSLYDMAEQQQAEEQQAEQKQLPEVDTADLDSLYDMI